MNINHRWVILTRMHSTATRSWYFSHQVIEGIEAEETEVTMRILIQAANMIVGMLSLLMELGNRQGSCTTDIYLVRRRAY